MIASRRILYLGVAVLLSGAVVLIAQQWLRGQTVRAAESARAQAARAQAKASERVLVARRALPVGTILKPEDLRWQVFPTDTGLADYLTPAKTTPERTAGAIVRAPLAAGEPLTPDNLARPGDHGVLAAVLQPGRRGVTIEVSPSTGVAGFLAPGDRVDLVLTRGFEGGQDSSRRFLSQTILQDVRVVGVDQHLGPRGAKDAAIPQTVTLELTPKAAEMVTVAGETGKLTISLRSLGRKSDAESPSPTLTYDSDFLAKPPAPATLPRNVPGAPLQARTLPAVVVVRGVQSASAGRAG